LLREAIRLDRLDTAAELNRRVWYAKYVLAKLKARTAKLKTIRKTK
jgi:hypothetical protein